MWITVTIVKASNMHPTWINCLSKFMQLWKPTVCVLCESTVSLYITATNVKVNSACPLWKLIACVLLESTSVSTVSLCLSMAQNSRAYIGMDEKWLWSVFLITPNTCHCYVLSRTNLICNNIVTRAVPTLATTSFWKIKYVYESPDQSKVRLK